MVKIPSPQVFVQGQGSTSADNLNSFVQVCDTAARLANFPGLPNMMVYLLGTAAPNDGGQGFFFYVNGTGFVSDGVNVIVPNGVTTGAWVRLMVPAGAINIVDNENDDVWGKITNLSTGNNASAGWLASNGTHIAYLFQMSTGYASTPLFPADGGGLYSNGTGGLSVGATANAPLRFLTNSVEQARFDNGGRLILQGTAPVVAYPSDLTCQFSGTTITGIVTNDINAAAGIDNAMVFVRNGSSVGSIQTSLTATTFNTSSDQNLKTEDGAVVDSGALIDSVAPHSFTWNATGEQDFGFFAQELEAAIGDVAIHAVSVGSPTEEFGTPEYKNWGVDMSQLVPLLWAEIRSLRARVAQLEGGTP